MGRSLNRFGRERHVFEKAKLLAVMLLTLKGTPFIYYGEELGMTNARIRRSQIRDRYGKMVWPFYKGRDQGRTPMQWNDSTGGGFTSGEPWLPLHKNFRKVNVESETADDNSVLNTYRRLIALRKATPTLQRGEIEFAETGEKGVLSYTRTLYDQQTITVLNFSSHKRKYQCLQKNFKLLFSTHRTIADKGGIVLYPFEAVVL
jgi:alpha-glucosidase